MRFEWFVTRRYLKSKPKRKFVSVITLISMAGVALGVMTLIIVLGVMSGFDAFLLNKIMGTESDLLVTARQGQLMGDYGQVMAKLEGMKHIRAASPIITNLVMLDRGGKTAAVIIRGIDLSREKKVTDLGNYLEEGTLKLGERDILLGKVLARNLGARLGDRVTVISPSYKPKLAEYKIKGFFRSGYYEYDANLAYLSLGAAQKLFGLGNAATGIQVKLTDPALAPQVAASIRERLNLSAKTWMQFKPNLFAALKLEKAVQFIIMALIVVVATFNIVSILDMVVSEKRKDIGILKSMGATRKNIMRIFIFQGLFIGLAGTILGLGLGLFVDYLLKTTHFIKLPASVYYLSTIPVKIEVSDIIYIVSAAVILTFLASLYPSWQASKMDPVEALRYE